MITPRFSLFGSGVPKKLDNSVEGLKGGQVPTLKLQVDKDVYRPGDTVGVTVEICNSCGIQNRAYSLLVEKLSFEIKGIEKLDTQWFDTKKPLPGSKQKRGERVLMECSTPSIIYNQIVSSDAAKSYILRTVLPSIIPPSYRGATIRYLYYVKSTLSGKWLIPETGNLNSGSAEDFPILEVRIPLQVWITQETNSLIGEEGQVDGIVPPTTIQMDIYWKAMDGDSDWARANDIYEGVEEGYDSSRDEISSLSSYNPTRGNISKTFESPLSLQSFDARLSFKDASYIEGAHTSLPSNVAQPRLSIGEFLDSPKADLLPPHRPAEKLAKLHSADEAGLSSPVAGAIESVASEGFIRGRSYNIKLDDQVLLRFSPRNSDSTYFFSDMIGGTLTFFHEEGSRRCLEISITLETSETVSGRFVHPSRRNSPTITKVQSDHYEVVADLVQTSFLFSIPMDGPVSFSTPHVSMQWALRFEFFTTPRNVDWTSYEHPLLIEGRDRSEWVLPITVHAPPENPSAHIRKDKPLTLEPLWIHN